MNASDDEIPQPDLLASHSSVAGLGEEANKLFEQRLSLMDGAATQILIDSSRGERDRLLLIALLGLAVSTLKMSNDASEAPPGMVTFSVLDSKLSASTAVFHYGLAAIILYFIVTFSLMAYLDVARWRVSISSKWLPFESRYTEVFEKMFEKQQSLVDNARFMHEQADIHFAADAAIEKQVEELEEQHRLAHAAGKFHLSSEILQKIIKLHEDSISNMVDLRPIAKDSQSIVKQMSALSARLDDLRRPVERARRLSRLQAIIYIASPILFAATAFMLVIITANR